MEFLGISVLFFFKPAGTNFYCWHSLRVTAQFLTTSKGYGQVVDKGIFLTLRYNSAFGGGPERLVWDCATARVAAGPLPGCTNPSFAGSSDVSCLLSMPCHSAFLVLSVIASIKERSFLCAGLWIRCFRAAGGG